MPKAAVLRFLAYVVLLTALPFLLAGTLDWWGMWALAGLNLVTNLGTRLIVVRRFPDLALERASAGQAKGVETWDRVFSPLTGVIGPLLILAAAALQVRFGQGADFPRSAVIAGWIMAAGGSVLAAWAMLVNRFFSAVARVQSEREHAVVTAGPYRWLRHPGYAGGILAFLGWPLVLGSSWALPVAGLTGLALAIRTYLEDRFLQARLPGYREYARQTRYRLLPGVW